MRFQNKVDVLNHLISKDDVVLDIGFWGQGTTIKDPSWPHRMLKERAKEVYGIDIYYEEDLLPEDELFKYQKAAAEDFSFNMKFDVIFAGDLIEHLVNPGLFLDNAQRHLKEGGRLIMSTPNAFNLFNLAGKITRDEPVTNKDHTFYFNKRTMGVLLEKCGWTAQSFGYMYTLDYDIEESLKKKFLNVVYRILSKFTTKFYETLIVVAVIKK
jgi:SAM-dependent methyltransferase